MKQQPKLVVERRVLVVDSAAQRRVRGGDEARFTGIEPFLALHAVPFVVSAREGRRVTGVDVQDIARGFC